MIRWKYVAPRLVLLAIVCLLLTFALDPLIRWSLSRAGRQIVGAQCEVGRVETSIWKSEIVISSVAIANPRSPMTNLLEFDKAYLDLDAVSLLKRKVVVDSGRLQAVRVGIARDVSGALADKDPAADDEQESALALPWSPESLQAKLDELEQQFESPPLVRELQQRWPQEVSRLESRVDYVEGRVDEISALARDIQDEPKQALQRIPEIIGEVRQIREDRQQLQTEVTQLANQVRTDREAVAAARHHDTQRIREYVQFDAASAEQIGDLVIGKEWTDRFSDVFAWVQWTRQYLPHRVDDVKPARGRGFNVRFPVPGSLPDFLVREVQVDGEWEFASGNVPFAGVLRNVTNEPRRLGKPALLTAQATGNTPFTVEVELDHSQNPPQERLVFDGQSFPQPRMKLGKEGQFAVHVEPGKARINVQLSVVGDQLTGFATIRQEEMQLATQFGPQLQDSVFAQGLQRELATIRDLETSVRLSGTLRRPHGTVNSTLSQELSAAMKTAVRQELEHQQELAIARLNEQIDQQLARAESTLQQKQEELLYKLQLGDAELQQITDMLPAGSVVGGILSGRLPWRRQL